MSWALRATAEAVEQTEGEALGARNKSLAVLGHAPGVGPPDLLWLRKTAPGAPPAGFYHWLLGQEVSSAASVAAYFAELCEAVEKPGLLAGLWGGYSQTYKVVAGEYRCYDAFSKVDLCCTLAVPGGVSASAIDASGAVHPATQQVWVGAWVSAFLRSELVDLQTLAALGSFKRMDAVPSLGVEEQLLECVEAIYRNDEMRAQIDQLHSDPGRGVHAEDWDVLSAAVYHHFRRRQRLEQACDFFSSLVEWHTEAAMYAALAEHELDLFSEAIRTLEGAVQQCPESVALKVALGQRLLEGGKCARALELARAALKLDESARCAWLLLANTYTAGNAYTLSLVAVNLTPTPPPFPDSKDILGVLPPPAYDVTVPREKQYDPHLEELMVVQEEAAADGNDELMDLPGAVMLPEDPHLGSGLHLDISQHRAASAVYAAVYSVLVDVVDAVGWDAFLEERRQAFLMGNQFGSSEDSSQEEGTAGEENSGEDEDEGQDEDEGEDGQGRGHGEATVDTTGQRTPVPAALRPAAAPPPSGSPGLRAPPIADASAISPLRPAPRSKKPTGVNPMLWSTVYGDSAAEGAAGLQELAPSDAEPPQRVRAAPRPRSAPSVSSSAVSSSESSDVDSDDDSSGSYSQDEEEDKRSLALQADRTWMINGDLEKLLSHQRHCVPWVDELITAVYKDLAEYTSWMLLDRRLRRAGRPGQAGDALGQGAEGEEWRSSGSEDDDDVTDIAVPVLLPVDWMRRGLMCVRLKKLHDAERAMRVAVHHGFNMTCCQILFQIYGAQGMVSEALSTALEMLQFHHKRIQALGSQSRQQPSPTAVWMVSSLVMVSGLQVVRDVFGSRAGPAPAETLMNSLFHAAVEWQTDGFDS
mmetsp:Transcript_48051/g.121266  ORF Transcript_48051/g.121266 Transcript_48051/m.121266 type:complete len:869 (-) Transcript_48051:104-2710(-)